MPNPDPRIVCISGGTSGIGTALVRAFLEAGDRVLTFGRDPAKVDALTRDFDGAVVSGALWVAVGDVTDPAFRSRLVDVIGAREDRLDILVNNAGVILGQGDIEESVETWRQTLEVNLLAPFALTQACLDLLLRSAAGVVINVSSACGRHPFETCTSGSYSASKAALDLMTQRLAMTLGPRGIRVNAVAPGVVASPMWSGAETLMAETLKRRHRLHGEAVEPEAVAAAVLFLASDEARRITGTLLAVDAGYALG